MAVRRPFSANAAELGPGRSMLVVERPKRTEFVTSQIRITDAAAAELDAAWAATLERIRSPKLANYSPDAVPRGDDPTVIVLPKSVTDEANAIGDLLDDADRPQVSPKDIDPEHIYLYAAISDTKAGRTVMLKKQSPAKIARAGKSWWVAGDELKVMEETPWQLHPEFDLVITAKGGFALNQQALEALLSDSPLLSDRVDTWITALGKALPLAAGQDAELAKRCKASARLRRRLRSINHRGHLSRVKIPQLRAHAKRMNLEPDDYIKDGKLIVSDANIAELLELLNEDLFPGGLTGDPFRSDGKAPLAKSTAKS